MAEEADNRHATDEKNKLIEKSMARQWTKMFVKFSEILMWFASKSGESSTWPHSNKIIPFKVKMNLYLPNLEYKIHVL